MATSSMIYLALSGIAVFLFVFYYRGGSFLKSFSFTAFTGLGALGILWLLGKWTGLSIGITPLTLIVSGLLGIPGVLGMLIFQIL